MRTAEILGYKEDAKELKALYANIKVAFDKNFFDDNGTALQEKQTQTSYLLALAFDLLPQHKIDGAVANLKQNIADCDNHLRTGFLGTPILPFVLDEVGETDLMYEILFKETYPSWFYSINNGATTMWERWDSYTLKDGFHKDGMNSFNHYAYGAIGQWMYERVAGIKPTKPGYKEIEIAPIPGGPLTSAAASYDSPYGKVSSSWKMKGDSFVLETVIPSNTIAKIIVPANTEKQLLLYGKPFVDNDQLKMISKGEKGFELQALPGTYVIETKLD